MKYSGKALLFFLAFYISNKVLYSRLQATAQSNDNVIITTMAFFR